MRTVVGARILPLPTRTSAEAGEIRYEAADPGGPGLRRVSAAGIIVVLVASASLFVAAPAPAPPIVSPAVATQIYTVALAVIFFFCPLMTTLLYFQPRRGPAITSTGIRFPSFIGFKVIEWAFSEMREVLIVGARSYTLVELRGRIGAGHLLPVVVRFFDPDDIAEDIVTTMAEKSGVRVLKRK